MLLTRFIFGLSMGLWFSTWLAFIHPLVPFALAYPLGFWVLWRLSDPKAKK